MKTLTIRQPWAGAIFELGKDVENRTWSTPYRGPMLIHAGSALFGTGKRIGDLRHGQTAWAAGAIIGVVHLVDVVKGYQSVWAEKGCWHWVIEDATAFREPIRANGAMGLWDTSPELTRSLCDLL
jgi:hypothetical protein